jgi:FKBP-type peptidyl-prolyl cis-trans isomerase FklB
MSRRILILALASALVGPTYAGDAAPNLQDARDRESYVMGYQFGLNLRMQGLTEVNAQVLATAVSQALEGLPSALSPEESKAVHRELKTRVAAYGHQQEMKRIEQNLETGKAFLGENAKKEGVKTLASGLQYRVIAEGTGPSPKETDRVTLHYRGTLVSGTEFASSHSQGRPATVQPSASIPGWREALPMMKVGSKWELFVPTELAYGRIGAPRVPPNSALVYEVELLSIEPPESASDEPPPAGALEEPLPAAEAPTINAP